MGRLYDACREVIDYIDRSGLDVYKTRGAITLRTGFLITLVDEDDVDDPARIAAIREAAKEVLGIDIVI